MTNNKNASCFFMAVLVLALPIALMAAVALPNEYSAQGIDGCVDCDGPIGVMIWAIPSYIVYGVGAMYFGMLTVRHKSKYYGIIFLICIVIMAFISPNVIKAYQEYNSPLHQETFGEGY